MFVKETVKYIAIYIYDFQNQMSVHEKNKVMS